MTGTKRRSITMTLAIALAATTIPLTDAGAAPTDLRAAAGAAEVPPLDLTTELTRILSDGSTSGSGRGIAAARAALADRETLLGIGLPEGTRPLLAQQHRNLDFAEEALESLRAGDDALRLGVALSKSASRWQAESMGIAWIEPVPLQGHVLPSAALLELATRYGAEVTPEAADGLVVLDGLEEPGRSSLARFVDAFLAFDTAARIAFIDADLEVLFALHGDLHERDEARWRFAADALERELLQTGDITIPAPGSLLADAGVDLALLFPTRNQLLDATVELRDALAATPETQAACNPVAVAPAFSIHMSECDDMYTDDFVLLLDVGGDDVYLNNAGGNSLEDRCVLPRLGAPAAALLDLGGNDRYGETAARRCAGANGGGVDGTGLLLDAAGDDAYFAGNVGTNGGAVGGAGLLLDAGGNDLYDAGNDANGGALAGAGALLDTSGDDVYLGRQVSNGGGALGGVGVLLDASGIDEYVGRGIVANGAGGLGGVGYLLDTAGDDTYHGRRVGANGGGYSGTGFLLDLGGDDRYWSSIFGTNGGGSLGGVGLLIDVDGNDAYQKRDITALAVGWGYGCALTGAGEVHCWGDMYWGPMDSYLGKDAVAVSAGDEYVCALVRSGDVRCWGSGWSGRTAGYTGGDAVSLGAGPTHACAVLDGGDVSCWGSDGGGRLALTYDGGDAVAVATGSLSTCALLLEGTVHCWGNDSWGQSTGYDGGDAIAIDAGYWHACALLLDGNVTCWGHNEGGQSEPYLEGDAVALDTGEFHNCVVRKDASVHCWGFDYGGETDGFAGRVLSVSAGAAITCAFYMDEHILCKGLSYPEDTYSFGGGGSNGGAAVGAVGILIDLSGDDAYWGSFEGVNGGSVLGAGLLVDGAGNDRYSAVANGVNGGAGRGLGCSFCTSFPTGLALLLDLGGTDTYHDHEGGSGTDRTIIPRGLLGAQVDV